MSRVKVTIDGQPFEIELTLLPGQNGRLKAVVNGELVEVIVPEVQGREPIEWIMVGNRPYELSFDANLRWLRAYDGLHALEIQDLEAVVTRPVSKDGRVKAPIPGLITRVMVSEGQEVVAGQPLLVLEAMKMENEILAPRSGVVQSLNATPGRGVNLGEVLVEIV
ncbi:MAG: biotin/lipoyl-binding protein [Caldilineales bacterium]|nr:biotin/lipoyl-binding protein [Caldilineales bacterium]MDW8316862.1 biotin/lipoyl-containing protein [Anaerolineae bacterium]